MMARNLRDSITPFETDSTVRPRAGRCRYLQMDLSGQSLLL